MGYFTWCALPFFLEAAGSGHRPTKYSLCTACAVLPRKESICILLAWQHNKETSMSPLLRPMKIWRSIWTTLMISTCLSSRILKKSPCSRFFNLMLKNYFVTWWAESCSSDFSTFPLLLDSTTPSQWSLNTKRQKIHLQQNSQFGCSTNSVANAMVYTKIRSTSLTAFFLVMFQILTSSISPVSADKNSITAHNMVWVYFMC